MTNSRIATAVVAAFVALSAPRGMTAQAQARVALTGGVATDQRGVQSASVTVAPGVALAPNARTELSLGGDITRYASAASSLGLSGAASTHLGIGGPFWVGVEGNGAASALFAEGASASFLTADVMPSLHVAAGGLALFGGFRAAAGHITQDANRVLVHRKGTSTTSVNAARSGVGPSIGAEYTARPTGDQAIRFEVRQDQLRVDGVSVTDQALTLNMTIPSALFMGFIGRRTASDENTSFGGVAFTYPLANALAFTANAGHYPSSRLTGSPGGTYVNAGFTVRLNRAGER